MQIKKQILTTSLTVLLSVCLIASAAYAVTTVSGTTITLSNGETIDNITDGTIQVLGGTLKSGDTNGVNAAGARTMISGYYKGITTAITGTGIGVEGQARQLSIDSSGTLQGGFFKAGNGLMSDSGGGDLGTMTGVYAEVVSSTAAGNAKTVTNARALELNLDLDQADTAITNAYGIYMKYNTGSSSGVITNGYGLWIDNESVQGTGRTLDAAIFVSDTSVATAGWDYGIDLDSATIGTADIRLQNSATITGTASGSHIGGVVIAATGAGNRGLVVSNVSTATTGDRHGAYIYAVGKVGSTAGTIKGVEIKGKSESTGTFQEITGAYINSDSKSAAIATVMRGVEIKIENAAGSSATIAKAVGLEINAMFDTKQPDLLYGIQINRVGTPVYDADIVLQNSATITGTASGSSIGGVVIAATGAGKNGLSVENIRTATTGECQGAYIKAKGAASATAGIIKGLEAKGQANSGTYDEITGAYINSDVKTAAIATVMRGIEIKIEGGIAGTIAKAVGLEINNGLQGTVTESYGIQISAPGTVAYTADIKLSSGTTISTGAGAPTSNCVEGSLYLRTDGGDNVTNLYMCDATNDWDAVTFTN